VEGKRYPTFCTVQCLKFGDFLYLLICPKKDAMKLPFKMSLGNSGFGH
jgi:hypothetical protein